MNQKIRILVFCLALLPLAWLAQRIMTDDLGVNPIETLNRFFGDWGLRFLLITLAITPLRKITGWAQIGRFRRMMGLFAFFYVCLHVSSYVGLDQFFDWEALGKDILKRRYITFGMIALVLMIPLAITSTDAMIKRVGGRRWKSLHKSVYVIGVLGVVHFWLMVKSDIREPMLYGALLFVLLAYRALATWPPATWWKRFRSPQEGT